MLKALQDVYIYIDYLVSKPSDYSGDMVKVSKDEQINVVKGKEKYLIDTGYFVKVEKKVEPSTED